MISTTKRIRATTSLEKWSHTSINRRSLSQVATVTAQVPEEEAELVQLFRIQTLEIKCKIQIVVVMAEEVWITIWVLEVRQVSMASQWKVQLHLPTALPRAPHSILSMSHSKVGVNFPITDPTKITSTTASMPLNNRVRTSNNNQQQGQSQFSCGISTTTAVRKNWNFYSGRTSSRSWT